MSKRFAIVMILAVLVFGCFVIPGYAQEPTIPMETITVGGNGFGYAPPDLAYISVGVETANADVTVAVNDANTTPEDLLRYNLQTLARGARMILYQGYREWPCIGLWVEASLLSHAGQNCLILTNNHNADVQVRLMNEQLVGQWTNLLDETAYNTQAPFVIPAKSGLMLWRSG
ncbi:MAG: hypothetical protein ACLFTK_11915 [Anaerolineales bacterium]